MSRPTRGNNRSRKPKQSAVANPRRRSCCMRPGAYNPSAPAAGGIWGCLPTRRTKPGRVGRDALIPPSPAFARSACISSVPAARTPSVSLTLDSSLREGAARPIGSLVTFTKWKRLFPFGKENRGNGCGAARRGHRPRRAAKRNAPGSTPELAAKRSEGVRPPANRHRHEAFASCLLVFSMRPPRCGSP